MLNAERFRNELLEILSENRYIEVDKYDRKIRKCTGNNCPKCMFGITALGKGRDSCSIAAMLWLLSEYKEPVKLSRLEYEILKWAKKEGYKYITRDEDCELCTFQSEPEKLNIAWDCCDVYIELPLFKKLFQFIQWADEKPTSIQEMLNNCEVIDND